MKSLRRGLLPTLIAILISVPFASFGQQKLEPGTRLSEQNWQLAEGLLPPEILNHYKEGGYANDIVSWPVDYYVWPPDFVAGSEANKGRYDVNDVGGIIDKKTGEQPEYLIGFPFPEIDEKDPKAAVKVLWNYFYRTWYFGSFRAESQLNWIKKEGLERRTDIISSFMFYDGVPADEKVDNPNNLQSQFLSVVVSPADLNGTAALAWRYRDSGKRDSAWSFVPALRRVRAVSPANRSDGFLGSDMSQDDGPFFDGKPEDFTWTLKGKKDELRFVDPLNLKDQKEFVQQPDGSWRAMWPDLPFLGYMDKDWTGYGWASRTGALAVRPHYIIEGIPRDKYYFYGKLELHIDAVTFQGAWHRKFSWKDELINNMQVMSFIPTTIETPEGKTIYVQGSQMAYQCAENVKREQATVAGIKSSPRAGFDLRYKFNPTVFDMTSLSRQGK